MDFSCYILSQPGPTPHTHPKANQTGPTAESLCSRQQSQIQKPTDTIPHALSVWGWAEGDTGGVGTLGVHSRLMFQMWR